MRILIGQPKLENGIRQLAADIERNPVVDLVIYPEGYLNQNVEQARDLARTFKVTIISGYKKPKDRSIIINRSGDIVLDKAKYEPFQVILAENMRIGHLLCDELVLQGIGDISENHVDLVAHPIGVGMFSEKQFEEWVSEARALASKNNTMIIGTSHADGKFRESEVSIPIAYCVDCKGEVVFIRKNDTRTVIFDTESGSLEVTE